MARCNWVIADIHGEYGYLLSLLDHIQWDPTVDTLRFLGDFVDRGPDSAGVIAKVRELSELGAKVHQGNHELMWIDAVKKRRWNEVNLWTGNGGGETMRSYTEKYLELCHQRMSSDVEWIKQCLVWDEDEKYFYSHAPLSPDFAHVDLAKSCSVEEDHSLLWYSTHRDERRLCGKIPGKVGVCGHVHALHRKKPWPRFYPHYYYLDGGSGCHHTGQLWACDLENMVMVSHRGQKRDIKIEV